ncbi:MAG: RelE/StbE family addiction module toxin [Microgenomates group bacterium Gr01-1014_16]|nr:MAG: RelE/StbE family addiction module toxin [Microgenomates group bacterium Gr01-1014_16]
MKLTILGSAKKQLKGLPKFKQLIISQKIRSLAIGEMVSNVEVLSGYKNAYRVRVGDYRIVYRKTIDEVCVLVIGHRKEVYKLLERLLG